MRLETSSPRVSPRRGRHRTATCLVLALAGVLAGAGAASAGLEPGLPFPLFAEGGETRVGSVLIYNFYSSGVDPDLEDTRFTLTNGDPGLSTAVALFFVDGSSTALESVHYDSACLGPNQTTTFLASERFPGKRGYVLALKVDGTTGLPNGQDALSGQADVWLASGFRGSLQAIALQKFNNANVVSSDGTLYALFFDGINLAGSYNKLPHAQHLPDLSSQADQRTLLVVNRIGGNLAPKGSPQTTGGLAGFVRDGAGSTFKYTIPNSGKPQLVVELTDAFAMTDATLSGLITVDENGWLTTLQDSGSSPGIALTGSALFAPPQAVPASTQGAAPPPMLLPVGATNLTPSTLTNVANVVLPTLPGLCP